MNTMWKKSESTYQSSAKVVDGNLILSLPDALNPIVWRMELGSVKSSALEVRTNQADGTFMLTLKTPKGDVHDIAPFATKDQAVFALMSVSKAMQNAEGRISPVYIPTNAHAGNSNIQGAPQPVYVEKTSGSGYKWIIAIVGVVCVIVLFAFLSSLGSTISSETATGESSATTVNGQPSSDKDSGVPQSADQYLRGM